MASPQVENGYTKIANEIMDALIKYRIPGEQRQLLDFIIRKTYGFNKTEDAISLSQFVDATGMGKTHIIRAINGLLSKKVINVTKKDNKPAHIYKFIKNYDAWVSLPKKVMLPKRVTGVTKNGNKALPKTGTTKDNKKDTITKDIYTYSRVIGYLNQKTGKNFNHKTKNTISHINARLKEGFTEQDFITVIDNKCEKWLTDPKFSEYLRPQTLFGTKFESYLNDIPSSLQGVVSDKTLQSIKNLRNWEPPDEKQAGI